MIQIKHFTKVRDGNDGALLWTKAEEWLATLPVTAKILHVKAYPTGPSHNLIMIVDDQKA